MAPTTSRGPHLHLRGRNEQGARQPTGTIDVRFIESYQKLKRTLNGDVEILDEFSGPSMPLFFLRVPPHKLRRPTLSQRQLSHAFSTLVAPSLRPQPEFLDNVVENIKSRALSLATDCPSFSGYSIVANLEFIEVEEEEETIDVYEPTDIATGASRSAIEKLINKGGFVADKSDHQEFGTCSICLEEFSSSEKAAELLRLDCSHLYHQSCILRWLDNHNTCPTCRRTVEQEE